VEVRSRTIHSPQISSESHNLVHLVYLYSVKPQYKESVFVHPAEIQPVP
jgi:hypothetical protein